MRTPTASAEVVTRRTYHRPLDMDDESKGFETWDQVVDRVIEHQAWLWGRALFGSTPSDSPAGWKYYHPGWLPQSAIEELEELRSVMLDRQGLCSGRTLWLGGTEIARKREASMFNCAFTEVETVSDAVDVFWLLLQGCGVGFKPKTGCLFSFPTPSPEIVTIPSTRTGKGGQETNKETWNAMTKTWTITIGDSAEAWAKALGKLVAGKYYGCQKLIISGEEIRPAGKRLKGYGWICHGDKPLLFALEKIANILNQNPGVMLSFGQIHEIINLLGTVLSSRRSAQLCLCDSEDQWSRNFATFKSDASTFWWKSQSNNTVNFLTEEPPVDEISEFIDLMVDSGGSEPGFRNGHNARLRAGWSRGTNPCAEILLPNKGFCNLVEINVAHPVFAYDPNDTWPLQAQVGFTNLQRVVWLLARANYRQTCVNLLDGILQAAWHENNQNLRLCGVGLTGLAARTDLGSHDFSVLREEARVAVDSMARELGLSFSAAVTTVKPSGTLGKAMDTPNGFHQPLGRYIFNWVNFGPHDPMLPLLREAGYASTPNPDDAKSTLVCLPVDYGTDFKQETAIQQLDRYAMLMESWCDHNVSCTIYYEPDEIPAIKAWLSDPVNWSCYVAVSFLPRNPTATYSYYPQVKATKEEYEKYVKQLKPITFGNLGLLDDESNGVVSSGHGTPPPSSDCVGGACPVR